MIYWWLMKDLLTIDWWLIDDWKMVDCDWLIIDWRMINWWLNDDWLTINWWLINDWLIDDWLMILLWLINDWLMIYWWLIGDKWDVLYPLSQYLKADKIATVLCSINNKTTPKIMCLNYKKKNLKILGQKNINLCDHVYFLAWKWTE